MWRIRSYSRRYYRHMQESSENSARAVVPVLVALLKPRSVVDVGCGMGVWLKEFERAGVTDALGVDGFTVDRRDLLLPAERFFAHDLNTPLHVGRRFDLVLSVEVGEHVAPAAAETFVESLTSLGDLIVFSAASPYQGGIRHVNEQWPEYWVERFASRGFEVVDCLRKRFWKNEDVTWFYAQNLLLFATEARLAQDAVLRGERAASSPTQLNIVHPELLSNMSLGRALMLLGRIALKSVRRRVQRLRSALSRGAAA